MRIHHLNCGTHRPLGGALFDGRSRGLHADLCTHCLLIETADALVLADTGYGLEDLRRRPRRLAHLWPLVLNVHVREEDTAVRQVEALGFSQRDVRHIVLTHLDFDHAGGIADFPEARVHVLGDELSAADGVPRRFVANQRYRPMLWHGVTDWRTYAAGGETWHGFSAVRALDGLPPEILMVPLPGHTLGHAGVAIATRSGWMLDAGDAYLHRGQLDPEGAHMPAGLKAYERIMAADPSAARLNLGRLRDLAADPTLAIFCSHDTAELDALRATPADDLSRGS